MVNCYLEGGESLEEVAEKFEVGRASVVRLVRLKKKTGTILPKIHWKRGPDPLIDDKGLDVVRKELKIQADATIEELVERYEKRTGVAVSTSTMSRALARIGFSKKRKLSSRRNGTSLVFRL